RIPPEGPERLETGQPAPRSHPRRAGPRGRVRPRRRWDRIDPPPSAGGRSPRSRRRRGGRVPLQELMADPWSLLGVEPGAGLDAAHRAYLVRLQLVHPDPRARPPLGRDACERWVLDRLIAAGSAQGDPLRASEVDLLLRPVPDA